MTLSTKINQGFTAVGTKVKELNLTTVKSVNSVTPNSSGNVKITMITGNAGSATKLQTARTITLSGDVSGSVSFDGSEDVSITATVADDSHNHTISNIDNLQTTLNAKAALASPTFTGTPKAPTATAGTNTTQIATTAFVTTAIANKTSVASATKATQDGSGNVITDTYLTKTDASNTYLGKTAKAASASSADSVVWGNVSGKPSSFTPTSHNQASNTINALTGYSKPSSTGALSTSDTLNSALGKLEKALDGKASTGSVTTALSDAKSYTDTKVAALVDSSPATLDTLNELAAALGDDPNFATTVATQIGTKANSSDLAKVATSGAYSDLSGKPTSLPANGGNADTVGGFTVGVSVPANAKFTDTIYTLPTAGSSLGGVKTTSKVTSTSGLTACPIISGVPYYKDTNTTYTLNSFSVTATASELNVLDGITATTAELNYCDGVTSNIQTQLNGKLSTSGTAAKAKADASGNTITSTYATKTELTNSLADKADSSHTHNYLPLSGGSLTGSITFGNDKGVGVKWGTRTNNGSVEQNPYMGYCTGSGDGTFVVGSLLGTTYQSGLAIGGSSGNLLWKGGKILDSNNFSEFALSKSGTAAKATSDASGNNIANTYAKKSTIGDTTTNFVAYFEKCMAS